MTVTYSVSVGATIQPKPFEAIRVDITYHNVDAGFEEQAILEGVPVVERLTNAAIERVQRQIAEAKDGVYAPVPPVISADDLDDSEVDEEDSEQLTTMAGPPPLGGAF